jgi:DNA polymerase-4
VVSKIGVSCYKFVPSSNAQVSLFDIDEKQKKLSQALDEINNKYGEFVITPAIMLGMDNKAIDRIAFGGVKEIESLYE